MKTDLARFLAALLATLVLACGDRSAPSRAETTPADPRVEKLEIGFNGKYKLGYWTELRVTFSEPIADPDAWLEATVWDGDGVPCTHREAKRPGSRAATKNASFRSILFKPGRPNSPLVVTLQNDTRVLATRTIQLSDVAPPLSTSQEIYLTCFVNDDDLVHRIAQPRDQSQQAVVVSVTPGETKSSDAQTAWERLPLDPLAYQAVDGVLFNASGEFATHATSTPQFAAMLSRAGEGGKLVLCAMEHASDIFTEKSQLPRIGELSGQTTIKSTALLRYAIPPDRHDLGDAFGEKTATWPVPKLIHPRGNSECADGEKANLIPIVIRQAHGFGEFVFVALDWDRRPLANSTGRGALFDKLFRRTTRSGSKSFDTSGAAFAHTGYDDLSGQLRAGLDRFPGVTPFPFWSFVLLVAAYLAVIGPLDYYVVHRMFQRMQAAWLTLPVNIIVFCGLAFVLSQYQKGTTTRVHQAELVDVILQDDRGESSAPSTEHVAQTRRLGWYQVFSPHAQRMDLAAGSRTGSSASAEARLEWFGLPGGSLGGMNSANVGSQETSDANRYSISFVQSPDASGSVSSPTRLSGFPIPVASSRPFTTHSAKKTPAVARIQIRRAGEGRLSGMITNLHDEPLDDCILFFARSYYNLGRLEPNQSLTLDDSRDPPGIASRLNRRRLQGDKVEITPYDPFDTDIRRILEIAMFYEASGGREYTHLQNCYLRDLDLSGQLDLGRAVLVGQTTQRGVELLSDSRPIAQTDDERVTLFRIMIPVEPSKQ